MMPVPVKETVNGLFAGSLVVIIRLAERLPVAAGVKITLIEQLEAGATVPPQVLLWEKSPGFEPVNEVPNVSAASPVLERVTILFALATLTAWLPNASDVGETPAIGFGGMTVMIFDGAESPEAL